jgi:hypothetical protein
MEGIKMNNIDNLIVCLAIVSCIMFTASVILGVYVIMIIKLFRDDIKKEKTFDKEMKEISGNSTENKNCMDEIKKRNNLKDFLRRTSLEKSNIDFDYSSIDTKEEIKKVDQEYGEEEIDFIHEKLIENEKVGLDGKSIKEELESLSIVSFEKDDMPYQSKIERSIEETDTNLSFIEGEPTIEAVIEDTEIIFDTPIKKLNTAEFRTLSKDEQLQYALNIAKDKYSVENLPEELKEQLYSKNLEKFCSNVSEFSDNKKVDVVKDSDTGRFKFDFETPVADIYKCSHDNYYNQGYQL